MPIRDQHRIITTQVKINFRLLFLLHSETLLLNDMHCKCTFLLDEFSTVKRIKLKKRGACSGLHHILFCLFVLQVDEWIEQNIYPLQDKTENLLGLIGRLTARRVWPRRPIP